MRPVLASIDRESRARLLAALSRRFRDIDLAEDALQEALARALRTWPAQGIPRTPEAWLLTVAKRAALDALRREQTRDRALPALGAELTREPAPPDLRDPAERMAETVQGTIPDDRLCMFFACAHPALKPEDRIALTLRFVAGLTTTEIAHALLMPRPSLQQRISRAKHRIRRLGISFEPPTADLLHTRTADVRRIVYLLFAEGFARSTGDAHVRDDLTAEAIRLARLLRALLPSSAETTGLLALLLLTDARRAARTDSAGAPVPLCDQDRALWDAETLAAGLSLAESAAAMPGAGSYAVQAAIAAVHAEAPSFDDTDWAQIAVLYRMLGAHEPGPIVSLGRAVALGRAHGPETGLRRLDALAGDERLIELRAFHVARGLTLEELSRTAEAAAAFRRALSLPGNAAEETFLMGTLAELEELRTDDE